MLLRQLGKRLEHGGNYYEVKFPAVPGAKRVRKRKKPPRRKLIRKLL